MTKRHVAKGVGVVGGSIIISILLYISVGKPLNLPVNTQLTPVVVSHTPPASPSATLIPIMTSNGICKAQHVNPNDPQAYLPDPSCTPGAVNPQVTQANLSTTICKSGYTGTIRPPVSYTNQLKAQQMTAYGFTDAISAHEEDHFISLELGGAPSDPKNLWPEPGRSPNEKDKVENALHKELCAGQVTLQQAQNAISTDWYKIYQLLP